MSVPLIAEISLSKLKNNFTKVKKLAGKTKVCAVVKSDAYGHGVVEISSALYPFADCFAVSLYDECIALRLAGIDKQILLLTPAVEENVERLIEYGITFTVGSLNDLKVILSGAEKVNKRAEFHIAINSGMNRLGVDRRGDILNILKFAKKHSNYLTVTGAYSHLCNSQNLEYSLKQLKTFKKMAFIVKRYEPKATLHVASSGGLLLGKKFLLDMVRVGILLYGYLPYSTDKISVEPIMKIKARTIINRTELLGKNLMYGEMKSNKNDVTLVRLGYADGFRRFGNLKIINNACMDMCAIDKTNDKYVTVLSNAEILAKEYKTITYEILVNVTKRAKRIYK